MIYVVFDTMEKNVVRAAFKAPEGMEYREAIEIIKGTYSFIKNEDGDGDDHSPMDVLESLGFESVEWLPVEV